MSSGHWCRRTGATGFVAPWAESAANPNTRAYTATVNSFLADGGDNFSVLRARVNRIGGPVDLGALIAYIQSIPQPFTVTIEGRILRLN